MKPRHHIELFGYRLMAGLMRSLPLPLAQALARRAGRALWRIEGKRVRWALENIAVAFPDLDVAERRRIGRESYECLALGVLDFVRAERWDAADVRRRVTLVGEENLHAALAGGRGAFLLSLHLGSFELAVRGLGTLGIRTTAVGRPMANEMLYERVARSRTSSGIELIDRRRAAVRMMRAIKRGDLVLVLNDQYSRRSRGVFVPLFGARCSTSAGIATIALRTGAKIVPGYTVRDGPDHHTVYFLPALPEIARTGNRDEDVATATAAYNEALERIIRRHPEQWMWGHRRFRHSPDIDRDLYGIRPV